MLCVFQVGEVGSLEKVWAVNIFMTPHYYFQTSRKSLLL